MPENPCACYCHCKQQIKTSVTGGETIEEKKQLFFFFLFLEQGTLHFHWCPGPCELCSGSWRKLTTIHLLGPV